MGCHTSTTSFATWTMNHTGITSNCSSCHGGQFAGVRSKPNDHPPTTADCSQCHNTTSFDSGNALAKARKAAATSNARRVPSSTTPGPGPNRGPVADARTPGTLSVHAGVLPGGCMSCHNGTSASPQPARHLATLLSCDSCHRTTAWAPANFAHTGVAPGSCATCHNGTNAAAKPSNHFVTLRSCDSCHRTTAWRPVVENHISPLYPTNHPSLNTCTACHLGNSELVTWRYPNLKPGCGGCHGPNFRGTPATTQPSPRPGAPGRHP